MIETLKASLAQEKINEFLELMQKLGYKNEEIITLMHQTMKGDTL